MGRWLSLTFSAIADQLTADWAILLVAIVIQSVKHTGETLQAQFDTTDPAAERDVMAAENCMKPAIILWRKLGTCF